MTFISISKRLFLILFVLWVSPVCTAADGDAHFVGNKPPVVSHTAETINLRVDGDFETKKLLLNKTYEHLAHWQQNLQTKTSLVFRADLSGDFPQLTDFQSNSKHADFIGNLKGSFPLLSNIFLISKSGDMVLNWPSNALNQAKLAIETRSGDVTLNLAASVERLKLTTVSGDTLLNWRVSPQCETKSIDQTLHSNTRSGDIIATIEHAVRQIKLTSESGNVELQLQGPWTCDSTVFISSDSGDINLKLPSKVNVDVIANTKTGDLHYKKILSTKRLKKGEKQTLLQAANAPTIHLELSTVSGDILIR